jgi:hypothetical protein
MKERDRDIVLVDICGLCAPAVGCIICWQPLALNLVGDTCHSVVCRCGLKERLPS